MLSSTSYQSRTLTSTEIGKKPYPCRPSVGVYRLMGVPPLPGKGREFWQNGLGSSYKVLVHQKHGNNCTLARKQPRRLVFKMVFLYQSDRVVAQGYANFQKLVRMAIRHVLNLGTSIITTDTILQKFAYPCTTGHAAVL